MSNGGNGGNGGNGCPAGCCDGSELLCISIPCPVQIVLLGALNLELEIPCIRLSSQGGLTGAQANQLLGLLTGILGAVGGAVAAAPASN